MGAQQTEIILIVVISLLLFIWLFVTIRKEKQLEKKIKELEKKQHVQSSKKEKTEVSSKSELYLGEMISAKKIEDKNYSNGVTVSVSLTEYGEKRLKEQVTVDDMLNFVTTIHDTYKIDVLHHIQGRLVSDSVEHLAYRHLMQNCFYRFDDIVKRQMFVSNN